MPAQPESSTAKPAKGPTPSVRERFDALRNLKPFLAQIWATSPTLTISTGLLRLARALLPVAMLYVGKLIIDEAVRLVALDTGLTTLGEWYESGLLSPLMGLLALEFGLAVLSDALGRIVSLVDSLLSELFTNATSVRLMEHAATLDLEDFEDSELQDRLDRARRQTMGRMTLMSQLFGQAQDVVTILSFAAGLIVYAPWLMLLLAVALIPAFLGEAHFNALNYSLNFSRTPERRELEYLRQTGASVETAKEVKIFGLHSFLIERFRELSWKFYWANRALAMRCTRRRRSSRASRAPSARRPIPRAGSPVSGSPSRTSTTARGIVRSGTCAARRSSLPSRSRRSRRSAAGIRARAVPGSTNSSATSSAR